MIAALLLLTALAAAGLTAAVMNYAHIRRLDRERREVEAKAATDRERLYGAWKDGFLIPPAPTSEAAPVPVTEATAPLIPELQAIVNDWDDERGRASQLRVIRQLMAQGKTQTEVLRDLLPANEDVFVPDLAVEVA